MRLIAASLVLFPAFAVTACYPTNDKAATSAPLQFSEVSVSKSEDEKHAVRASNSMSIGETTYPIAYQTILRSGDKAGSHTFGQLQDVTGKVLIHPDQSPTISNATDFSSLLPIGQELFMVTQFEDRPGGVFLTQLQQDQATGKLSPIETRPLDFSHVDGGWMHCAGSVTPWNSHLGGEEYPPEASWVNPETGDGGAYFNYQARYFQGDLKKLNPYHYGYQFEVKVDSFDKTTVVKHYAMGRISHELAIVMPDQKTAYLSDDDTNGVFLKFIADAPGDLSSGELFAARWHQTSDANGGAATLDWVSLGHTDNESVHAIIKSGVTFDDIFKTQKPDAKGQCSTTGYTYINNGITQDCLKLKPGMELTASRLETRRYAALKGATAEFRKLEGVALDTVNNHLYVSTSSIQKGMEDGHKKHDLGGPNHIRLPKNKCGTVFKMELNEHYNAHTVTAEISGTPVVKSYGAKDDSKQYDPAGPLAKNKCDLDSIANPDNLGIASKQGILFIGEDSGSGHQNDAVWAYDLKTKKLTRILSTPYGSEATSVYHYPDINGWSYLMTVVQHPYGESDQDKARSRGDLRAYTGYIGPWPTDSSSD